MTELTTKNEHPLSYVKSPLRAQHEMVSFRSHNGKLWDMGGQKRFIRTGMGPIHYQEERGISPLLDIDTNIVPIDGGATFRMDKALFDFNTLSSGVGFTHVSKGSGDIEINLMSITVAGVETFVEDLNRNPVAIGDTVEYNNLLPGVSVHFQTRAGKTKPFKLVDSSVATPVIFRWESAEGSMNNIIHTTRGIAFDNFENLSRSGRSRLKAEILIGNRIAKGRLRGKDVFEITETLTGRTAINTNPNTRAKNWQNARLGTIKFNQDITEDIVAALDDGQERTPVGDWEDVYPNYNYHYIDQYIFVGGAGAINVGYRFQGLAIGNGDTINAGTQLVVVSGSNGANTHEGDLYADVGSTRQDAFSDTSAPSDIDSAGNLSTATSRFSINANSTTFNINTVAIIQELVDLGGWASGDDLRLPVITDTDIVAGYHNIEDYSNNVADSANLEVNFTAASGDLNINVSDCTPIKESLV